MSGRRWTAGGLTAIVPMGLTWCIVSCSWSSVLLISGWSSPSGVTGFARLVRDSSARTRTM